MGRLCRAAGVQEGSRRVRRHPYRGLAKSARSWLARRVDAARASAYRALACRTHGTLWRTSQRNRRGPRRGAIIEAYGIVGGDAFVLAFADPADNPRLTGAHDLGPPLVLQAIGYHRMRKRGRFGRGVAVACREGQGVGANLARTFVEVPRTAMSAGPTVRGDVANGRGRLCRHSLRGAHHRDGRRWTACS